MPCVIFFGVCFVCYGEDHVCNVARVLLAHCALVPIGSY